MMFLPSVPLAPAAPPQAPSPQPEVIPALYAKASPTLLAALSPAPSSLITSDRRVDRADERFQKGKLLYQRGDFDGAREEFDKAVDLLLTASVQSNVDRRTVDRKMDEMIAAIYRYDLEGLGSGEKQERPSFDKAPLEDVLDLTFPLDPKLKPKVKDEVTATGSQLPLQVNDQVLSYINFFNSDRGRRTLLAGLRRAGKYRPMISRILAEENVPQELIFLAQAESGFLPRAVSQAAATGMWQFIRERGNQYGLRQTPYSDDRLDPEKATRAAARHLRDLYQQFGDWHLAIAAYNCGPGCVDRAVQRTGYADYWQLRARGAVPRETTNYVPIILAMTIMAKNPADYGLENIDSDAPIEYENVSLSAATSLALVADLAERSVAELQELNPALLGHIAPAGYELHVPKGAQAPVAAALLTIPEARRTSVRARRVTGGSDALALASKPMGLASSTSTEGQAGDFILMPAVTEAPRSTWRGRSTAKSAATTRTSTWAARNVTVPRGNTRNSRSAAPATALAQKSRATAKAAPQKTVVPSASAARRARTYTTASLHRPR